MISSFLRTATLALVFLLAVGCEDDVAAPPGVEEPFSIYGILNPLLPTQTLLVSPTESLLAPAGEEIDAVVTSTDLTTGETYAWQDSVATNATGQIDHVFWSDFRPDFGSRHRIEVTRSDGRTSSVEVEIPIEVTVEEEDTGTRNLIVYVQGDNFQLVAVDAVYTVRRYPYPSLCDNPQLSYSFSSAGKEVKTENGWRIELDLGYHYFTMANMYREDTAEPFWPRGFPVTVGLALMKLELRITVGNEAWNPPGSDFNRNVLVHPGTLSNVRNGFGFVGGGYNQDFALYPSAPALSDTWFFDFLGRPYDYCSNPR